VKEITSDTATTIAFLQEKGTLKKSVKCPGPQIGAVRAGGCEAEMTLKAVKDRADKVTWRCRRVHSVSKSGKRAKIKDVKLSIRAMTWLEDSNLPLGIVLELMYLWSQGATQSEIQHETRLSHQTIVEWCAYLREVTLYHCYTVAEPIGGKDVEVEIDESKFGKRKYYKGHRVDGKWVFGGREKRDKTKVFMFAVQNRKKTTLLPLIERWIKKGSIIHSDCWASYKKLGEMGYQHKAVNHSKEFVNKETGACTNKIESEWRHAKVKMPSYGVHRGHHDGYLAKFLWFRKFSREDRFHTLLRQCNEAYETAKFHNVHTSKRK
jgi:transposase-like protein